MEVKFQLPQVYVEPLFSAKRFKVLEGGRGSAKSTSIARWSIARTLREKDLRVLCVREWQSSIRDSVHALLKKEITDLGLAHKFSILDNTIRCPATGSDYIFRGINRDPVAIQSIANVGLAWVEEGQSITKDSWRRFLPTIRTPGSQIVVSFNPDQEDDPVYAFAHDPPDNAVVLHTTYRDNPFFPAELDALRLYDFRTMLPEEYAWVWEGATRKISGSTILRNVVVHDFDEPEYHERLFYGVDWGYTNDPTVMIRCYIQDDELFVTDEAYSVQCELDDTPALFAGGTSVKTGQVYPGVPGSRTWPIKADNARPECISYIRRQGFNITPAEKWPGCVEDRIAHLKAFRRINVHTRCVRTAQECRLYSYKVDKQTGEVLPKIVDKHNHTIDAIGYALDGYIQRRGVANDFMSYARALQARGGLMGRGL